MLHHHNTDKINKEWRRTAFRPLPVSPPPIAPHPQEPAQSKEWQTSSSPLPPPDFLPNYPAGAGCCCTLAHDLPFSSPSPSPALPVLNESRYCPLSLEEIRRGVKLRKVEKHTCKLDNNTARQMLLKQIQQEVRLKPVSSDVTKSEFLC